MLTYVGWKLQKKKSSSVASLFATLAAFQDPQLFPISHLTTASQFSSSILKLYFPPLRLITCSTSQFYNWSSENYTKKTFFLWPSISRGYSESVRPCSGSPVTWKPYARSSLNLLQPFFFLIEKCMDKGPSTFVLPLCAALILGHHPVMAWSHACCD